MLWAAKTSSFSLFFSRWPIFQTYKAAFLHIFFACYIAFFFSNNSVGLLFSDFFMCHLKMFLGRNVEQDAQKVRLSYTMWSRSSHFWGQYRLMASVLQFALWVSWYLTPLTAAAHSCLTGGISKPKHLSSKHAIFSNKGKSVTTNCYPSSGYRVFKDTIIYENMI